MGYAMPSIHEARIDVHILETFTFCRAVDNKKGMGDELLSLLCYYKRFLPNLFRVRQ